MLPVLRGDGVALGIFMLHLAERRARGGELCPWRDPARFSGLLERGTSKAYEKYERDVSSRQTEGFMSRKARIIEETAVVSLEPEKCVGITSFRGHEMELLPN
jgi:hypothetical protein